MLKVALNILDQSNLPSEWFNLSLNSSKTFFAPICENPLQAKNKKG